MREELDESVYGLATRIRSKKAKTWIYFVDLFTAKEIMFWTGRWTWLPLRLQHHYNGWNTRGLEALPVEHTQVYWLCFGWSKLTYLNYLNQFGKGQT